MDEIVIRGGHTLTGTVRVSGAKNAALPMLAASLIPEGVSELRNVPDVRDVRVMCRLMERLGVTVRKDEDAVRIDARELTGIEAPYELVRTMRASVLLLGPLLARMGRAKVSMPGGCAIGNRPIDLHLKAFHEMGADVSLSHGMVDVRADRLTGNHIYLDFPTVTGTENIMMAAVSARGTTEIHNAAREPEIVNLAEFLNGMGASVHGAGSERIIIEGVEALHSAALEVIPDRIEAGTFAIAAAITHGDITLERIIPGHLDALWAKLGEAGVGVEVSGDTVRVRRGDFLKAVDVQTAVYPGYPTDLQAQFMALMCIAEGKSVITENIFENRFMHVAELNRMGADIVVRDRNAFVRGDIQLSGAEMMATDLRASASLVLAGLAATGDSRILRVYHLDRGYEKLEIKLQALGADIHRVAGSRP